MANNVAIHDRNSNFLAPHLGGECFGNKHQEYNETFGKQMAKSCDYAILVGNYGSKHLKNGLMNEGFDEEKIFVVVDKGNLTTGWNSFSRSLSVMFNIFGYDLNGLQRVSGMS